MGTGSIGLSLRNPELGKDLKDQIEYMSVDVFQPGMGMEQTGEYSLAGNRRKHRLSRRLHQVRRRRLWATLKLLIAHDMCPMSVDSLKQWSTYDKTQALFRIYPVNDKPFESWIRLDFDGDGFPDYSSPYQLRRELMERQFDFSQQIDRYKLGRAIYHIAQRRAFKSSKGMKASDDNSSEKDINITDEKVDITQALKGAETKLSQGLNDLMEQHNLTTAGQAMAMLEDQGVRIRNNASYRPVRSMLKQEIIEIFKFQDGLDTNSELLKHLLSEKKGEGTIFYKNPLRSQRGLVGKCTLESNKSRCPISHPEYERFRALCFLNNVKYREDAGCEWKQLPLNLRQDIYDESFVGKVRTDFRFEEIKKAAERALGLNLSAYDGVKRINYRDDQSVSGCPVTARLMRLMGNNWQNWQQQGDKQRQSHGGKMHQVSYNALDIWDFCYNADEPEQLADYCTNRLHWDDSKLPLLNKLWDAITQGYAMLSLKAIKKINAFLELGLLYPDAVILAKVPEITGETNLQSIADIYSAEVKEQNSEARMIAQITNNLIAHYKALTFEEQFAYKNTSYELQESDEQDILTQAIAYFGRSKWDKMERNVKTRILQAVEMEYQSFFSNPKRDYAHAPKLEASVKDAIRRRYPDVSEHDLAKLYHHSQISIYPVKRSATDSNELRLGEPNVGGIKNPVVLRTLHVLKRKINAMLDARLIDPEETRLVVETTRSFNDANMRWAIEEFNRNREAENKAIFKVLSEHYSDRDISEADIDKARYMLEQGCGELHKCKKDGKWEAAWSIVTDVKKYKLWLEQGCRCIYTGNTIRLRNLFDDNVCDLEHTIPRSISFDSSDANLTVCDSHYNRAVKGNRLPTQLPNYETDVTIGGITYRAIKPNLDAWREKVERLTRMVQFWKRASKLAADKDRKDRCVRQRHLWQMELNYWRDKLNAFTVTEVSEGFRNSQLVDTGIITRYATLYLKNVFRHVDVQKGSVTAAFRKMLGVQSVDEKKDRSMHSHHAIDATMLSVIPVAVKRERMLKLFYQIEETEKAGHDCGELKAELRQLIDECHLGHDIASVVPYIESNILINRRSADRALAEARKKVRVRGKEKKVFKGGQWQNLWAAGDGIRGRLHKETYLGAVKLPNVDSQGHPVRDDGHFSYSEKPFAMVARVDIKSFADFKDLDIIVDPYLRERLKAVVQQRMAKGNSFNQAIAQDIWPLDKNGKERHFDRKGRPLSPIRHVRCHVKAGRGYMTFEKSITIRKQTYSSTKMLINVDDRDYKKHYYALNDTNYAFLLYWGTDDKGKITRASRIVSLFELAQLKSEIATYHSAKEFFYSNTSYNHLKTKKADCKLKSVFVVGTRVLLYENSPGEVTDVLNNPTDLSDKLYVVVKFNNRGSDSLYISKHLNAESGEKAIDSVLVANKINCLVEGEDFEVDELGQIKLLNR